MFKTLRARIIALTMIAITIVIVAISTAVNITNSLWIVQREDNILRLISDFNGQMPENTSELEKHARFAINEETPFQTRYFVIYTTLDGTITETITSKIASIEIDDIERLNNLTKHDPDETFKTIENYRCLVRENNQGRMVTFLDRSQDNETITQLNASSMLIALIGVTLVFLIIFPISKRILQPFVLNREKQQQFITDAGHELKTPLAIIRTNAEVLEMCGGSNEWLDSIKNQTERMDGLIKGLLQLSKSGELAGEAEHIWFPLSAAVNEIAIPFHTLAEQKGHKMHFDIKPGIEYKGNAQAISTLVSILCDNAIKYASEGGEICVSLYRMGKSTLKTAKLVVENDTDIDDSEDPNRFFERFYRSESSRSRQTGGYGIGLSVAQTIIENHKGKITVSKTGNRIVFTVIL